MKCWSVTTLEVVVGYFHCDSWDTQVSIYTKYYYLAHNCDEYKAEIRRLYLTISPTVELW